MNVLVKKFFNIMKLNSSSKRLLLKNTAWVMTGEAISKFILFLVTLLVARYLGVDNYGRFTFSMSFVAMFSVILDFGFNTLITRDLAKDASASHKIGPILLLKFLLTILFFVILFISALLLHTGEGVLILLALAGIYTVIQSFFTFFQSTFQAYEKMQYNFILRTLSVILLLLSLLIVVHLKLGISYIFFSYIISSILSLVFALKFIKKLSLGFGWITDLHILRNLLIDAWPFVGSLVGITIYTNLDSTIISITRNYQEVGLYQSAYKILFLFQTLNLVHQILFPRLSKLYHTNKINELKLILKHIFLISLVIVIPIGLIFFIFAKDILYIVFGNNFTNAYLALRILISTGVLVYFFSFWGYLLMVINNQKRWFYAIILGAIVNVVLNLIFVPRFGYNSAAVITLVSEVVVFFFTYFSTPKNLRNFFIS